MLPLFPKFKSLELSDRSDVEEITKIYPPYCDFNFLSMWSWDVRSEIRLSQLEGNLIVKFTDYLTGEPFYSFFGENKVNEVISTLIDLSVKEGLSPALKLVPEFAAEHVDLSKFLVVEDRDNFDYVYKVDRLAGYVGNNLRSKKNLVNRFNRSYENKIEVKYDLGGNLDVRKIAINIFKLWVEYKKLPNEDVEFEYEALLRLLDNYDGRKLITIVVFVEKKPVGFLLGDILDNETAMIHFEKGLGDYPGIFPFLMQQYCIFLKGFGVKFVNYEQDLGIEGLRLGKKSYRIDHYLKKMIVKKL